MFGAVIAFGFSDVKEREIALGIAAATLGRREREETTVRGNNI